MSKSLIKSGRCMCGAVHFSAIVTNTDVTACHCNMCQRWAGGPFLAMEAAPESAFEGWDHISVYDSSAWAERGFCSQCGSGLFYRLKETGAYAIPVGLLDDFEDLTFAEEIYIDRKPALYAFANQTRKRTEEEVEAQFQDLIGPEES